MNTILQDVRYAARMFRKTPGFTVVALLTLALGIGANTAIFTVFNAVLLRPLALRQPERLVSIYPDYSRMNMRGAVSPITWHDYQQQTRSFENIAAAFPRSANLNFSDSSVRVPALRVSANFFRTLGIDAARGRTFADGEDEKGSKLVVLSDSVWRSHYGSDSNLVGGTIRINGETYQVIGIMPPGFQWGTAYGTDATADLWLPAALGPDQFTNDRRGSQFLEIVARMKPGVTLEQAKADIDSVDRNLARQFPLYYPAEFNDGSIVRGLQTDLVASVRPALLTLLAAAGLVLLIACSNVANLLMSRATVRQREIAIRTALGAPRSRIIRQLLTESLLLGCIAGVAGMVLGLWIVKFLIASSAVEIPRLREATLDTRVLAFSLLVSFLTSVVFGLAPAFQTAKIDLQESLKDGSHSVVSVGRRWMRNALVVAQISLALILLTGAGLLIGSFVRLQNVDRGFKPDNLLTMQVSLSPSRYGDDAKIDAFYRQAEERLRALPGVKGVGVISSLPLGKDMNSSSFVIEGRPVPEGTRYPQGDNWVASTGYFETMNIPLVAGRLFTEADTKEAAQVVIISADLAKQYFRGEDPIGKRIDFEGDPGKPKWRTIVGIVGNVKQRGLDEGARSQYYVPLHQLPFASESLVLRTAGDPTASMNAARNVLRELDPLEPVYDVRTMEEVTNTSLAPRRFSTLLLGSFSSLALLLACIGLYGVLAYSVAQRTREIGIRMALGAQTRDVLGMVLGDSMRLTIIGLVTGLVASFALSRFLASMLFNIKPTDPPTYLSVSTLLVIVALLASYIPARRAARVNPTVALRYE